MPSVESSILDAFTQTCKECGIGPSKDVLRVDIGQQKLEHWRRADRQHPQSEVTHKNYVCVRTYTISTGLRPPSCIEDSLGTPLGLHVICEKIGDGQPEGMVFIGRIPTGRHYSDHQIEEPEKAFVTTRILRLRGLQQGYNAGPGCDTFNRYVYIHGTSREHRLGHPDTHGCPVLSNREMIELYDSVPVDTLVWIEE